MIGALTVVLFAAGPDWVTVPAGEFTMGCDDVKTCADRQKPRNVTIAKPFLMMSTEVTVGQFREFVKATAYRTVAEQQNLQWYWSKPRPYKVHERQPVMYVTAKDAESYCSWVGGRLPFESEWTWAFRANETVNGRLWWNTDPRYVWFRENSDYEPHTVATRLPNGWGLYDMEGNAWEWTKADPPSTVAYWIRGGSWIVCRWIEGAPPFAHIPEHGGYSRSGSDGLVHIRDDIGFRCVRDVPDKP